MCHKREEGIVHTLYQNQNLPPPQSPSSHTCTPPSPFFPTSLLILLPPPTSFSPFPLPPSSQFKQHSDLVCLFLKCLLLEGSLQLLPPRAPHHVKTLLHCINVRDELLDSRDCAEHVWVGLDAGSPVGGRGREREVKKQKIGRKRGEEEGKREAILSKDTCISKENVSHPVN